MNSRKQYPEISLQARVGVSEKAKETVVNVEKFVQKSSRKCWNGLVVRLRIRQF